MTDSVTSKQNVVVLGSTGSVGRASLEVLGGLNETHCLYGIAAHTRVDLLEQQVQQFSPGQVVVTGVDASGYQSPDARWHFGNQAMLDMVSAKEVDIVVAAIVGRAGLESSIAAVANGKRLALANKESLVVAGPIMTRVAKERGATILPVDSEHSAIFQAIRCGGGTKEIARVILTASGGSLRSYPKDRLVDATVEETLTHPTWKMGKKITVDSATMMNKALEIIEACWLFDLPAEKIQVVIHPQSFIHSMVEFVDGSIIAQMSPPDMRLPIQYALTFPERVAGIADRIDWTTPMSFGWETVDLERYPALRIGFEVASSRGTSGAVLNGANEAAVELFLANQIRFTDIAAVVKKVLDYHEYDPSPTLDTLLKAENWARAEVSAILRSSLTKAV